LILDVYTFLVTSLPFICSDFDQESPALLVWGTVGVDCGFSGVVVFNTRTAWTGNGNTFQERSPGR
jgi:hypothetical protein